MLPLAYAAQSPSAHPDFSGRWHIDEAASDLDSAGGWFGSDVQVTHDAKSITFAAPGTGPGTGSSTYTLDGKGTPRTAGQGTRLDTAAWVGDRIILTTVNTGPRTDPATQKEIETTSTRTIAVSLDKSGAMIVDVTTKPESTGHFARHSVYRKQ